MDPFIHSPAEGVVAVEKLQVDGVLAEQQHSREVENCDEEVPPPCPAQCSRSVCALNAQEPNAVKQRDVTVRDRDLGTCTSYRSGPPVNFYGFLSIESFH